MTPRIAHMVCLLLCGISACGPVAPASPGADPKAASATPPTGDGAAQCAAYGVALCGELGAESAACEAAKQTTALMPPAACKAGLADIAFTSKRVKDKAQTCTSLMEKLCGDLGEQTGSCKMVREQTPQLAPMQCDEMMDHYAEVLADLQRHEAESKPLSAELRGAIAADAPCSFGPTDAAVTVVEFSDFECPYCSRAARAVQQVKEKFGPRVRLVFRQFPLSFHSQARLAAEASLAAAAQGKFWEFHDRMFDKQRDLGRETLEKYAGELGLDLARFRRELDDGAYRDAVEADIALGDRVSVSGTPTMFINGARVSNPTDPKLVTELVEAALAH